MAKDSIDIESFLSTIPNNTEGINKEKIRKEFRALDGDLEGQLAYMQRLFDQAEARAKDLRARQSQEDRKARTRRLIKLGALVESALGTPDINHDALYIQLQRLQETVDSQAEALLSSFGQAVQNALKRPLTNEDLQHFVRFLNYEEERGSYFSAWMNN